MVTGSLFGSISEPSNSMQRGALYYDANIWSHPTSQIHIVWYVTCNPNMWVITVSSLGCLRCGGWQGRMVQEPQGREGERLCSGNQDSFYMVVLISPQARQSLRCVCEWVCVRRGMCMYASVKGWAGAGQLCVPLCLNYHLWMFKLVCAWNFYAGCRRCYLHAHARAHAGVDSSPLCQVCEHAYLKVTVCERATMFLLCRHNRVRLLLRTQAH